jgi:hypothetical protein
MEDNRNKEKQLQDKLNKFLKNKENCEGEECIIKDPQELVQREHKKIITNDGRQLLSEYTI